MRSINEIMQMNEEELAAENRRLVKRLVLTRIVVPIVITAAVHYGVNYLLDKLPDVETDD